MLCRMLLCAVAALPGPGDPPAAPSPPADYDVQIRYHISAYRNEHVAQYFEMLRISRKPASFVTLTRSRKRTSRKTPPTTA